MASAKQLDLGSGDHPRQHDGFEAFGVDLVNNGNKRVKIADLAIEPIPYGPEQFKLVTAYDFIEHLPAVVYIPKKDSLYRRNPIIELFNEIYRVLEPVGEFYMQTPAYIPGGNSQAVWQDPTHLFVWTPETANYFSGDYYGMHDDYGHTSDFTKVDQWIDNGHICLKLRANKPARQGEYTL